MARPRTIRTLAAFGVVLMLAASLGGCGRRGRLLPPPDPNAPPEQDASASTKAGVHRKPVNPPIVPPKNNPFILDPIL